MKSKHRTFTEKQKQILSAFGMLGAGILVIIGTGSYIPKTFPLAKHTAALQAESAEPETKKVAIEPNDTMVVEVKESEDESQPPTEEELRSAIRLNMAYQYPEGTDNTDVNNSIAGKAYRELSDKDAQWLASIYGLSNITPLELANQQGRSVSSVMGAYDVTDATHVVEDPGTWTINSWSKINTTFYDGNGNVISGYSNKKEIISMVSVYSYFNEILDEEAFLSYCRSLWKASHGYRVQMGDVYYCDGCVGESKDHEASIDGVPREGTTTPAESETVATKALVSENAVPETLAAQETLALSDESTLEPIPADWHTVEGPQRDVWESMIASSSDASLLLEKSEGVTTAPAIEVVLCPGHIDLRVSVTIYGLTGANSLFTKDGKKGEKSDDNSWGGWDKFNRLYAKGLEQTDWFSRYGLTVSDNLYINNPLSPSEISFYMNKMPEDTSAKRRQVIKQALQSVGCIPYYWGGKPSTSGLSGNQFGTLITPDSNGRALRGLDCSGWINWVYWTVLGTSLPAESTSGLTNCGVAIAREALRPGDIIIKTGEDAHVFMFLSWAEDGSMYLIHETGGLINNVTVSHYNVHWPYYRSLLNE